MFGKKGVIIHLLIYILLFGAFTPIFTVQCQQQPSDACRLFYNELERLPGEKAELSYHTGIQRSIVDGKERAGCEVRYVPGDTTVAQPQFVTYWTDSESNIYKKGWRINERWTADGPDSMSFALEKNRIRCNISDSWNFNLYPSEVKLGITNIIVQCHEIKD